MDDICPYSKNGICNACKVLKINCDGERFALCTQYQIATGKITPEEVGKQTSILKRDEVVVVSGNCVVCRKQLNCGRLFVCKECESNK